MDNKYKHLLIMSFVMISVLLLLIVCIALNNKNNNQDEPVIENKIVSIDTLDEKQQLAYDSIATSNKYYGFYYDSITTINDISNERMFEYALSEYIISNNMEIKGDLTCFIDLEKNTFKTGDMNNPECKEVSVISKEKIDSLIKEKFNTDRVFEAPLECKVLPLDGTINYVYDGKSNFYVGVIARSGGNEKLYTRFVKAEKDNDFLYIYDKAFVCNSLEFTTAECRKGFEVDDVIFTKDYAQGETIISEVTNDDYNTEFILNSYDTLIDTYKHTFKIVDDNYYWVSSDIEK